MDGDREHDETQIGGQGDGAPDPHHLRADARLTGRAAREGWARGLTEEMRKQIARRMALIALKPDSREREAIAATKALLSMDRLAQQDEELEIKRQAVQPTDELTHDDDLADIIDDRTAPPLDADAPAPDPARAVDDGQ